MKKDNLYGKFHFSFQLQNSNGSNLLQKAVLEWDSLKLTVTAEHKLADNTRAFWEGASPRLAVSLELCITLAGIFYEIISSKKIFLGPSRLC